MALDPGTVEITVRAREVKGWTAEAYLHDPTLKEGVVERVISRQRALAKSGTGCACDECLAGCIVEAMRDDLLWKLDNGVEPLEQAT